ncbi:MAG: RNA pseudouridine synthase [Candidatus Binatia bacterium]|nr:RNA pseudouridine synthase [Candidatus Binatia bacterium]
MPLPAANPRVRYETVFVDGNVLIVAKPRGRVTMPGKGHARDTLVNGVFADHGPTLSRLGARRDYGLLHRLDRATSGLVAFALTEEAYDALREAFATRRVEKTYLTIVQRRPPGAHGVARMRLSQVRRGELRVSVPDPRGVEAITHWQVLASAGGRALLSCRIETGRLHQIRAHLATLGCPVEGDTVYGSKNGPDTRASVSRAADKSLLLHAWRLSLPQPGRRKSLAVEAEAPDHFRSFAADLGMDLDAAIKGLAGPSRKA